MRAVMQTDEILSTLHEIRADILVVRGKVDATQADLTRVETKLSALASRVEGMNDKVTTQEVQDAAQQKQIELLGTSVAAVKAKQVGWASLAWAIGVGAFYLIQLLLGGKLPAIGQPPTIQHLPLPPGITAPLDSVAGCLRLPVYKPADSVSWMKTLMQVFAEEDAERERIVREVLPQNGELWTKTPLGDPEGWVVFFRTTPVVEGACVFKGRKGSVSRAGRRKEPWLTCMILEGAEAPPSIGVGDVVTLVDQTWG